MWQQYPQLPWLLYAPCGCAKGGFNILDKRSGAQYHAPDMDGVHQAAADLSGQGARVPLGDAVHNATQRLGLSRCTSCAKRQTWLNRLFG